MKKIIPQNHEGVETNTEASVDFENDQKAKEFYRIARERLLSVKNWHEYAGSLTADFALTDVNGTEIDRSPEKGCYFRISIPGPGSVTGEGYDWVRIEEIVEDVANEEEYTAIRVRPAPSPVNDSKDVAHFFSGGATSSFIVRRVKNVVTAGVYGRNEKPNTSTDTVVDKIRNAAVAAGAISGFSKLQWKSLVNGLVKKTSLR